MNGAQEAEMLVRIQILEGELRVARAEIARLDAALAAAESKGKKRKDGKEA